VNPATVPPQLIEAIKSPDLVNSRQEMCIITIEEKQAPLDDLSEILTKHDFAKHYERYPKEKASQAIQILQAKIHTSRGVNAVFVDFPEPEDPKFDLSRKAVTALNDQYDRMPIVAVVSERTVGSPMLKVIMRAGAKL